MIINITPRSTRNGQKIYYSLEWGKGPGERSATGIFTYAKPKDQLQRNHNKEALSILETKRSQLTLERQAIGTGIMPSHKFKANFLDYYAEFVENNKQAGNRHLEGSFAHMKSWAGCLHTLSNCREVFGGHIYLSNCSTLFEVSHCQNDSQIRVALTGQSVSNSSSPLPWYLILWNAGNLYRGEVVS